MLTVAETATGVIVACVPTLGVVIFPKRVRSASSAKYTVRRREGDSKEQRSRRFLNIDGSDEEIFAGSQAKTSVTVGCSDAHELRFNVMGGVGVRRDIDVTTESF